MPTVNHEFLLQLLYAIIFHREQPPLPEHANWDEVIALAIRHDVFLPVFECARQHDEVRQSPRFETYQARYDKRLVKALNQSYELKHLEDLLNSEKIAHLFLKGAFLRNSYPRPELREMSDIDILIPADREADALRLVKNDGYQMQEKLTTSYNTEHFKPPYQIIELHTQLVPTDGPYFAYYEHIWDRIHPDKTKPDIEFSLEEQYIYLIVHMAKHYFHAGTGIRSILDIAVFEHAYGDSLNREYIENAFAQMELTEFARDAALLAAFWFSDCSDITLSKEQRRMHNAILTASTYGTTSRKKAISCKGKWETGVVKNPLNYACFLKKFSPIIILWLAGIRRLRGCPFCFRSFGSFAGSSC